MGNTLLLRRRAAGASTAWTPKQLGSSLVGWWRADDLSALADGAAVSSWADRSTNGNTLTQATGANQPVFHSGASANAINGRPVVSFTAANSHHLDKSAPTGLPSTSSMWVLLVQRKTVSANTFECMVGYGPASGNGAWFLGTDNGAHAYQAIVGSWSMPYTSVSVGGVSAPRFQIVGTTASITQQLTVNGTPQSVGTGSLTAPARLSVGWYPVGAGGNAANGDVAEVIYGSTALTAAQARSLGQYLAARYGIVFGTPYNASSAITWGASNYGGGDALEVDAVYDPTNTFGHPYWYAYIPNATTEDPSVVYADTPTATPTSPGAFSGPVIAHRANGTNADPHLRLQQDGKWYLYYQVENDSTSGGVNNGTFAVSTSDPRVGPWSAPVNIMGALGPGMQPNGEAVAVWDGTGYVLFGAWIGNTLTKSARSSSPTGPFTGFQNCSLPIPGGRVLASEGEFDVRLSPDGQSFLTAFVDNDSPHKIWFATSPVSDGVNWTVKPTPVLVPSYGWDNSGLYRPSFTYDASGGVYKVWYSASNRLTGYTTLPRTEVEP